MTNGSPEVRELQPTAGWEAPPVPAFIFMARLGHWLACQVLSVRGSKSLAFVPNVATPPDLFPLDAQQLRFEPQLASAFS